jgi:hypothetical protein
VFSLTGIRTGLSISPSPRRVLRLNTQPWRVEYLSLPANVRQSSGVTSPEKAFSARVQEIKDSCSDPYPRLPPDTRSVSCSAFRSRYAGLENDQTVDHTVVINGRSLLLAGWLACT